MRPLKKSKLLAPWTHAPTWRVPVMEPSETACGSPAGAPSRYATSVEPSDTIATWCQALLEIALPNRCSADPSKKEIAPLPRKRSRFVPTVAIVSYAAGRGFATHAMIVNVAPRVTSGPLTRLLTPSKERPLPYLPRLVHVAPEIVPSAPLPELSSAVPPLPSLKL